MCGFRILPERAHNALPFAPVGRNAGAVFSKDHKVRIFVQQSIRQALLRYEQFSAKADLIRSENRLPGGDSEISPLDGNLVGDGKLALSEIERTANNGLDVHCRPGRRARPRVTERQSVLSEDEFLLQKHISRECIMHSRPLSRLA